MLYRKYGKTGEQVSALGFGCMRLPVIDGDINNIDEDKAIEMIRYAIDHGVNYIDTAFPYHGTGMDQGGASELLVAKALKDGYRERVHLATKLPSWLIKTRADFDHYLQLQLERLGTDRIDFYLLHTLGEHNWPVLKAAGVIDFLDQAIKDGRIKYAGFSFHDNVGLFKQIVDAYDWSFCQIQYNYLDEEYQAGKEGLEYAAAKGLGVAIMEPLRGGKLAANLPPEAMSLLADAETARSLPEWALRWIWNHPEVSVVLSGMSTLEQVVENVQLAAAALPNSLTEQELMLISKVRSIFNEKLRVNCTSCGYCMPCPQGVNIPGCFSIYNDYGLFGASEGKQRYNFLYGFRLSEQAHASNCIGCGKCERHCPQGIAIREHLDNVCREFEPEKQHNV